MRLPLPRTMKGGVPPTARNARTGELTPPGMVFCARANNDSFLLTGSSCRKGGCSCARATAIETSSRPRCRPSARIALARSRSSLMTNGMRASRHSASSAVPCSRRSAAFADLLRYCKIRAPPASALRTLRASDPMSGSSGVTAYKPRTPACETTQRSGLACARLIHFPRPKEPVRYVLTHARTKPRVERLPRVFLGLAHRLGQLEAVGERRRDRRGKRATRSVITSRQSFPAVRTHHAFWAVECVDDLRRVLVRAGNEHVLAAQAEQFLRSAGKGELIVVLAVALNQAPSFAAVGGQNCGLG